MASQEVIEFRHLLVVKREFDVPGYRSGTIPPDEIDGVTEAFELTLPAMVASWSGGRVRWRNESVVSRHVLRTTGGGTCAAEWLASEDISGDLSDHVSRGQYDCLFVYTGYKLDSAGAYGGDGPLGAGLVTYSKLEEHELASESEHLSGMFHEWCHAVAEAFYRDTLGIATVPGIHHDVPDPTWVPEDYGRDTAGRAHWLNWYEHYLNGTVRSRNGRLWGLGEACWSRGTRRNHYR